ncbi:MAG: MATE family efflux transporter [Lachnospiraceae bacterium]|nr:MATE family efflux transporter [Lachnospiraceae bacterium]
MVSTMNTERYQMGETHYSYKKIFTIVLPPIVSTIFTAVYNIVDGVFISNFAGKDAFAALNLIYPWIMVLSSFGFMLGAGGSALVAKTMGEGQEKKAREYFTMLSMTALLMGVILAVLGWIFMEPMAYILGADATTVSDCLVYGRIQCFSLPFFVTLGCYVSFWVTAGKERLGFWVTVLGGVCNAVFDWIFMYLFHMGLKGAAIATAMNIGMTGFIPLIYFAKKRKGSSLWYVPFRPDWKAFLKSCSNGASEMVSNLSMSFVTVIYNLQLVRLAGNAGVDAYGVVAYIIFICISFFLGYGIGIAPSISFHYGARHRDTVKELYSKSLRIILITGLIMSAGSFLMAVPAAELFASYDGELYALTVNAVRLSSLAYIFAGINIFSSAYFTALNNGLVSAVLSFSRTFALQIGAIYLLVFLWGLDGIWVAQTVAEIMTLGVSVYFLRRLKR